MTAQTGYDPDAVSIHYVNADEWLNHRYEQMASMSSGELSGPEAAS
jgi:hypothetical protein